MNNWLKFCLNSCFFISLSLLTACGPDIKNNDLSPGIVYCSEDAPSSFSPLLTTNGTTMEASSQIYNSLVENNTDNGTIIPSLAHQWFINDDATIYTFYLRKNVKFHHTKYFTPTRNFNADDVLFTFNRIIKETHPYHGVSGGSYPFFTYIGFSDSIKKVVKVNDYMVSIHLYEQDASFLANLATDFSIIQSEEYANVLLKKQRQSEIDNLPIGTGPFMLEEYSPNKHIRYRAHKDYWDGPPSIDKLVFDITAKSTNRIAKLITGDCDVSAMPQSSELKLISNNNNLELQSIVGLNVAYWAFNTQRAPFNHPKVRQALAHAINKQAIIDAVYYGTATIANNILPPSSWAYNNTLTPYEYNVDKAKELLAQAGYPQGFTMTLWASPIQRSYNPNALKMAGLIQGQMALIGVNVKIVSLNWNVLFEKFKEYQYDSLLMGWTADNADPDNFFRPLFSCAAIATGGNHSNWCYDDYDETITQAITISYETQRRQHYFKAQAIISQQVPFIPIAHAKRFQVIRRNIGGVTFKPYGSISFAKAHKKATSKQIGGEH